MENKAQKVLDMEKTGQAGPEVAGEGLERTGSWVKQRAPGLSDLGNPESWRSYVALLTANYCFKIIKRHAKQISIHQIWLEDNQSAWELKP